MVKLVANIEFPKYSGLRCLMMPYIQGDAESVPQKFSPYRDIINDIFFKRGDIGYLTIDESPVEQGRPHRGSRSKTDRALHTEAGRSREGMCWGGPPVWGGRPNVTLDMETQILLANNLDDSCAVWNATHENTSIDGDIGHEAGKYPYSDAAILKAGEVFQIGILTPHESLPVKHDCNRQFLRILSSGVHGREPYFTENPVLSI